LEKAHNQHDDTTTTLTSIVLFLRLLIVNIYPIPKSFLLTALSLTALVTGSPSQAGTEPINLSDFSMGMGDWFVEAQNGAEAESTIDKEGDGPALRIQIIQAGPEVWNVQLMRSKLGATKGQRYVVTFEGMVESGGGGSLYMWCQLQEDGGSYGTVGKGVGVGLTSNWQEYSVEFSAENLEKEMIKARLVFGNLGVDGKTIWLKNVRWNTVE
jgi:hypothetical protein